MLNSKNITKLQEKPVKLSLEDLEQCSGGWVVLSFNASRMNYDIYNDDGEAVGGGASFIQVPYTDIDTYVDFLEDAKKQAREHNCNTNLLSISQFEEKFNRKPFIYRNTNDPNIQIKTY